MIRARLLFFAALCGLSCLWAATALYASSVRLNHRPLITALRNGTTPPPAPKNIARAIASYTRATQLLPCNAAVQKDLVLLHAYATDTALASPDMDAADAALTQTHDALMALTACTPMDGKAWLDLANIATYREGFSPATRAAYAMSAKVSPSESWLAEKRLIFILKFLPVLDAPSRAIARGDLATLSHAHYIRTLAVIKAAQVTSPEALAALFTDPQ